MPILKEKERLYPGGSIRSHEWQAIREAIRERAGDGCEGSPAYPDCRAKNGEPHPVTGSVVVCTVAHFDHDETNNDPANLRFWCQRCHNTHDADHRRETARSRLAIRDLFGAVDAPPARPSSPRPRTPRPPIERLARRRDELTRRALALPRRSHTRLAIETELLALTTRLLRWEFRR